MNSEGQSKSFGIERVMLRRGKGMESKMADEQTVYVESDELKSKKVEGYNYLFSYDKRIRVAPSGEVYVKSYASTSKMDSLFVDLPSDTTVKIQKVIWNRSDDIENAIRRSEHIMDRYDPESGEVMQNTKEVIGVILDLSRAYHKSGITEEERQSMARDAAVMLVRTKFASAQKPEKQKILSKILAAGQRDALERINPPRNRFILTSAWLDLTRELIVGRKAGEKYRGIHSRLLRERELERFLLQQTLERIDDIEGTREHSSERTHALVDLQKFVYQYNSPDYIKVKPYSKAAAIARFYLFGDGVTVEKNDDGSILVGQHNMHLRILGKYIGDDNVSLYHGLPHFGELDSEGKLNRLRGISFEFNEVRELGDINLQKAAA